MTDRNRAGIRDVNAFSMLDRRSPIPLYHQLSELLLGQILDGRYRPQEAIPTERELMDYYHVSRITVRQAIGELERRGFVQRIQGRGTYVESPQVQRGVARLTSFSQEIQARGMQPGTKLLVLRMAPARGIVARRLMVEDGTPLWQVERLRLADNESIALNLSYLHLPPHVQLTRKELKEEVSLWALLERKGIKMVEADKTIEATVAGKEYARLLNVPEGAPLLLVEGVVYTAGGAPLEFHQIIGRADRYKYYLRVSR